MKNTDMDYICNSNSWSECYLKIRERSPIIADKNVFLFDKTPIYMLHLSDVLTKAPDIPCVVNVRDPRALMLSWARWSGHATDAEEWINLNISEYCNRYSNYATGYQKALLEHSDRIYVNRFEEFCMNPTHHLEAIFKFIGLDFNEDYL